MEIPQKARLQIISDLNELEQVLIWFDQFHHSSIPQMVWLQCQLALAEGFINAVRHAHQAQPDAKPIEIEVIRYCAVLEMRIWDYGDGFDLDRVLARLPAQIAPDAEGGRGLSIMNRLADVLSYTHLADHRNCLLMVKHYAAAE